MEAIKKIAQLGLALCWVSLVVSTPSNAELIRPEDAWANLPQNACADNINCTCEVRGRTGLPYYGYGDGREAYIAALNSCAATNDQPCVFKKCWGR